MKVSLADQVAAQLFADGATEIREEQDSIHFRLGSTKGRIDGWGQIYFEKCEAEPNSPNG